MYFISKKTDAGSKNQLRKSSVPYICKYEREVKKISRDQATILRAV
jgi:hypothetical protein